MDVLVLGGSGFIGTALCAELVERGHDATALSRDPDAAALPGEVETSAGDVTDVDAIAPAFDGRDAVVNCVALASHVTPRGGERAHERVHLGGTENALAAAYSAGVERFVQVSALGADPEGPTHYVRAKGRADAAVRDSELAWVLVRPSVVFGAGNRFLPFLKRVTTPYVAALPGGGTRTRVQPIWVGDLAPMLADAVADDAHVGATYDLGGPEVLTLAEMVRLVYRAEGRPVRILPVPMPLARVGLAAAGVLPGVRLGPDQYRSLQFDNTVDDNDVEAFGVDPEELRTLAEYLGVAEAE